MAFEARINDYDNSIELRGMATLVAPPSDTVLTYVNGNNETKEYRLATIEIELPDGTTDTVSTQIHKANLDKMDESEREWENGTQYLTTLRPSKDGSTFFAQTSHLIASTMSTKAVEAFTAMVEAFKLTEGTEETAPPQQQASPLETDA